MHIYGPAHLHGPHGPQPIGSPHGARGPQAPPPPHSPQISDQVDISDAARLVEQTRAVPEIRVDRVAALRAQIAEGTYETQQKLEIAVERLLDEIG